METGIVVFSVVWCVIGVFFMYRMWRAHRFRIAVMKEDLEKYARLPSYAAMVFKFWRPFSYFSEDTPEHPPEQE